MSLCEVRGDAGGQGGEAGWVGLGVRGIRLGSARAGGGDLAYGM